MKKSLSMALSALTIITALSQAAASQRFYFKAGGGVSMFHNKNLRKSGKRVDPLFDVALGIYVRDNFRVELNYQQKRTSRSFGYNSIKLTQHINLLNAYYDFRTRTRFTPYMTGGIGYITGNGRLTTVNPFGICKPPTPTLPCGPGDFIATSSTTNARPNGFIWNVGIGSQAMLSRHISLDLAYKFMIVPKLKSMPHGYSNLNSHQLILSLVGHI